jgi:DNA-binding MarR family transcriptional regulator
MPLPTSPKRHQTVADALHSASIHLLRGVRKEDEASGIGPAQLSALSVLVFGGPMRLSDLARLEQVKPPTMTKVIAGLEARGLVTKHADTKDARAVLLEPTPRGKSLLHQGRRRRVIRLAEAFKSLKPTEIELLYRAAIVIERVSRVIHEAERKSRHSTSTRSSDNRGYS